MEGKSVQNTGSTPVSPDLEPETGKNSKTGQFGPYKTEVQQNVTPQIPSKPHSVFQKLDGLFLPVPDDFFSIFERPLMGRSMEEAFNSVQAFNLNLLKQMGFPEDNRSFFSHWALVNSGLATVPQEETKALLKEARELLDDAPEGEVKEKVTAYRDVQTFEIQPRQKPSKKAFDKLWQFFERLFTSPFNLLSGKKTQPDFIQTLEILNRRVHGPQPRTVAVTTPDASTRRAPQTTENETLAEIHRQEEQAFILKAPRQTPVYYDGKLHHIIETLDSEHLKLRRDDNSEVSAAVSELYLPPAYKEATRICKPEDVDLPPGEPISDVREKELLFICGYLEKGDQVIYKDQPCTVINISRQLTSPQVRLKTEEGKEIDAALHKIFLPTEKDDTQD